MTTPDEEVNAAIKKAQRDVADIAYGTLEKTGMEPGSLDGSTIHYSYQGHDISFEVVYRLGAGAKETGRFRLRWVQEDAIQPGYWKGSKPSGFIAEEVAQTIAKYLQNIRPLAANMKHRAAVRHLSDRGSLEETYDQDGLNMARQGLLLDAHLN